MYRIASIIKQTADEKLVTIIRHITQSYKPDSRVTRFTHQESHTVIQQIIESLKYRFAGIVVDILHRSGFTPQES